jgi:hypothetical protein
VTQTILGLPAKTKFGGSRPAGLAVKGTPTISTHHDEGLVNPKVTAFGYPMPDIGKIILKVILDQIKFITKKTIEDQIKKIFFSEKVILILDHLKRLFQKNYLQHF